MLASFTQYRTQMKITIIGGTGAIGAFFAMQLVSKGHKISLLGRPRSQNLDHIITHGIQIRTSQNQTKLEPCQFHYIGEFNTLSQREPQDIIIVCLKQPDMTPEIAGQICALSDNNTIVGFVNNGLAFYFLEGLSSEIDHLETIDPNGTIVRQLRSHNIIGIQPIIAATLFEPGSVSITRPLDKISVTVGSPNREKGHLLNRLAKVFNDANINTTVTESGLHKNILEKLQFALSINTLSALMEKNIGFVFDDIEGQYLIKYVILLLNQLAHHLGIEELRGYDQFKSISITREHFSSLYQDIQNMRTPEIKALLEAPLELCYHFESKQKKLPSLKPLEFLKELVARKSAKETINLGSLFKLCEESLASYSVSNSPSNRLVHSSLAS